MAELYSLTLSCFHTPQNAKRVPPGHRFQFKIDLMHHAFDAGFLLKIWFVTSAKFQCESFELNSPSFSLHFPASISPFFSSAPVYFPRGRLTTGSKNGSMDGSNKMEDSRVCPCGGLVCRAGVWGRGPRPVRGVRRPRGGRRRPRRRCGGVLPLGRIQHILAGSSPGQPSPSKREGGGSP